MLEVSLKYKSRSHLNILIHYTYSSLYLSSAQEDGHCLHRRETVPIPGLRPLCRTHRGEESRLWRHHASGEGEGGFCGGQW